MYEDVIYANNENNENINGMVLFLIGIRWKPSIPPAQPATGMSPHQTPRVQPNMNQPPPYNSPHILPNNSAHPGNVLVIIDPQLSEMNNISDLVE